MACNHKTTPQCSHAVEPPTPSSPSLKRSSLVKLKLAAAAKQARRGSAKVSGLKNRKGNKSNPSYNGPVDSATFDNNVVVVPMMIKYQAAVTFTSGTSSFVWPNNPNNDPGWSSLAAEFDEYRILAMDAHFAPWDPYDTSIAHPPIVSVVDHSADTVAITTYDNAIQYESSMIHDSTKAFKRTWKASGYDELLWTPTAVPVVTGSIKTYATTGGTTGNFGRLLLDMRAEFRGKL